MMQTCVAKFGVRSILEHCDEALAEMAGAHRYYNELMRLRLDLQDTERALKRRFVAGYIDADAVIDAAEEQIAAVYAEIKSLRAEARAKLQLSDEQKGIVSAAKTARAAAWDERRRLDAEWRALLEPCDREFDRRSTGAPDELLRAIAENGAQLKAAKKVRDNPDVRVLQAERERLKAQKYALSPKTHQKREANLRVLTEMLDESQWPEAWKEWRRAQAAAHQREIELRAESGLTHGTYAAVEAAIEQAFKLREGVHSRPWYRRWDGGRKIGRQLTASPAPLTWGKLLRGGDSRLGLQLLPIPTDRKPGSRREHWRRAIVSLPIGKGDARRNVSVEVLLHREIPEDAVITWVYLVPRRVGIHTGYTLQFTLNTETPLRRRVRSAGGECTVRLRWHRDRSVECATIAGIVVAEIDGEPFAMDGQDCRQLGRGVYETLRHAQSIRESASRLYESSKDEPLRGARDRLARWISDNPEHVSEWLRGETSAQAATEKSRGRGALATWRNHERLRRLARGWIESLGITDRVRELWLAWLAERRASKLELYEPDAAVMAEWLESRGVTSPADRMAIWLDFWRRKDEHLFDLAGQIEANAYARRKTQYRTKANQLAAKYGSVAVYELDLAQSARLDEPGEDDGELHPQARYQRHVAAPSEFKDALKAAFGADYYREVKRERSGDERGSGGARKTQKKRKISPSAHGNGAESGAS